MFVLEDARIGQKLWLADSRTTSDGGEDSRQPYTVAKYSLQLSHRIPPCDGREKIWGWWGKIKKQIKGIADHFCYKGREEWIG